MPEPIKILFVDDEPDLAPLIRQKFRRAAREGTIELAFASDGQEALDLLQADPEIRLVVTDINMPRMDGLVLLGHLADLEQRPKAVVVTAYSDMENIRTAMNRGAFDFLTKPIDLADLEVTVDQARAAVEREREADRVREAFGRYLSDDIAQALLSDPEAFELGGERREVSVLMSDLSGFSQIAERLPPERTVELLNVYLGTMTEVVDAYGGAIDEFIGDAVLVIFGAPIARADHAERAVACAVAMQRAMAEVNDKLERLELPSLEMTAAVNTGVVVVGTIGSKKRAKYGVVGSPVNLTSRIQSLAAPGEVVISETTRQAVGDALRLAQTREASLKGFAEPIPIHCVAGVLGAYDLWLPDVDDEAVDLPEPVPVTVGLLDGKQIGAPISGRLVRLSRAAGRARLDADVEDRSDLRLAFPGVEGQLYAKVVGQDESGVRLRFSSVPPTVAAEIDRLVAGAA